MSDGTKPAGTVLGIASLLATVAARADAIDGYWCQKNGKRLSIEGSNTVTPNGTATTGDCDRHAFACTAPPGAPGAGKLVDMVLIDDDTLQMTPDTMQDSPDLGEIWHRCRASELTGQSNAR